MHYQPRHRQRRMSFTSAPHFQQEWTETKYDSINAETDNRDDKQSNNTHNDNDNDNNNINNSAAATANISNNIKQQTH